MSDYTIVIDGDTPQGRGVAMGVAAVYAEASKAKIELPGLHLEVCNLTAEGIDEMQRAMPPGIHIIPGTADRYEKPMELQP
jgi:hypothetical protein